MQLNTTHAVQENIPARVFEPCGPVRFSLGGIALDALTYEDLVTLVQQAEPGRRLLILNHNLHSLYLYITDTAVRDSYRKGSLCYIDGVPVVWLGRLAGLPLDRKHRFTFLDRFDDLLAIAELSRWRVFYLGSNEETLQHGLKLLRTRFPKLSLEGRNGFFTRAQEGEVVAEINAYRPHLLFVGMGMPLQEAFLSRNLEQLEVAAALTSGGTLDYMNGGNYRPPAWAGPLGLYGVMRLAGNPRRLWRRYLWEPVVLLRHLTVLLLRQRFAKRAPRTS